MPESTRRLRALWKEFECNPSQMVAVPFGGDKIRVAPRTVGAWNALSAVLFHHHGYVIRTEDTDSYNCRNIKGTAEKSLHSFGIALDINWKTNPFIDHQNERKVRFSNKKNQHDRAEDVRLGKADTDFTEEMIEDVLAIQTTNGKRVFEWGGNWQTVKDCMHFEIDVGPDDLSAGIAPQTVKGISILLAHASEVEASDVGQTSGKRYQVIARDGLRLRAGPSTEFKTLQLCAAGTILNVLSIEGAWALIDLHGDSLADGYVHTGFIRPA